MNRIESPISPQRIKNRSETNGKEEEKYSKEQSIEVEADGTSTLVHPMSVTAPNHQVP